ncbi:aminotransferase class IV, partial [Pelagibacterium lacus]
RWTTFKPPAAGQSSRYRGLILHRRSQASSSAFIVTQDGVLVTRPIGNEILAGVTRQVIIDLARRKGLRVEKRAFAPDETLQAAEAFSTSASTFLLPVVSIDGTAIGSGGPGPISSDLRQAYAERALR